MFLHTSLQLFLQLLEQPSLHDAKQPSKQVLVQTTRQLNSVQSIGVFMVFAIIGVLASTIAPTRGNTFFAASLKNTRRDTLFPLSVSILLGIKKLLFEIHYFIH